MNNSWIIHDKLCFLKKSYRKLFRFASSSAFGWALFVSRSVVAFAVRLTIVALAIALTVVTASTTLLVAVLAVRLFLSLFFIAIASSASIVVAPHDHCGHGPHDHVVLQFEADELLRAVRHEVS